MDELVKCPGRLTRRSAFGLVAALLALPRLAKAAESSEILVYKDPNCSCCTGWVRHLQDAGFVVTVRESTVLHLVRRRLGVPDDLAACHTAEAGGYILEGHVPAVAVRRLLETRPEAIGLAVPGMPVGAPGVGKGDKAPSEKYEGVLFGAKGRQTVIGVFRRDIR